MKLVGIFLTLFYFFGLTFSRGIRPCQVCKHFHPQSIICKAGFVGIIRVTQIDLEGTIPKADLLSSNAIAAEATILQVFKGSHEDFEVGSSIYLYAPSDQNCQIKFLSEDILISGKPYNGGLLSTKCDLHEANSLLTTIQLNNIRSHIRNRAYQTGCHSCAIKQPYDHSPVQNNECIHPLNEFPISTIACLPIRENGGCDIVRNSKQPFIMPVQPRKQQPKKDFEDQSTDGPKENGCLTKRKSNTTPDVSVNEEPSDPIETKQNPNATPKPKAKRKIFRLLFDWSNIKAKRSYA